MTAFRNKVLKFSTKTRNEIDKRIQEGIGSAYILAYLKENHKDEIGKLSRETVDSYIKYVKNGYMGKPDEDVSKALTTVENELAEIEKEQQQLETTAVTDKAAYIDVLIFKINKRLTWLANLDVADGGRLNTQKEHIRIKYLQLAETFTMDKAKLGGEVDTGTNIVVNVLQSRMGMYNRIVFKTVKEVCPDKLIEFQEAFKKNYLEAKGEMGNEETVEASVVKKIN